jgi:hypothetical protein
LRRNKVIKRQPYLDDVREMNEKFGTFLIRRKPEMVIVVMPSMSSKIS